MITNIISIILQAPLPAENDHRVGSAMGLVLLAIIVFYLLNNNKE